MARIAILALEHAGHLIPLGGIGLALQQRGHEVTVVARTPAQSLVERLGLRFAPLVARPTEPPRATWRWRLDGLLRRQAFGGGQIRLVEHAEETLEHGPRVLRELGAEGMIVDQNPLSGGTIAEHLGLPYVTAFSALMGHEEPDVPPIFTTWPYRTGFLARCRNCVGYGGIRAFHHALIRRINQWRVAHGLSPRRAKQDFYSPLAQISPSLAEFDFPRRNLPDVCHYVGALGVNRPEAEEDFPWDRLDGRPLIFASIGTVNTRRNAALLRLIVEACRGVDAQVVLALGKWSERFGNARDVAGELDASTIVVDYAPQLALLRSASLLITHGGQNTVMEAIAAGTPMVVMPRNGDQFGVAARVARAGNGLLPEPRERTPRALRAKIEFALRDPELRRRAETLRAASMRAGGPGCAAEIVERALTTRRPVTRAEFAAAPASHLC